jgi:hypothetical protein
MKVEMLLGQTCILLAKKIWYLEISERLMQ